MTTVSAFLLSREWRDRDDGIEIVLWGRSDAGPIRARFTRQEAVMFVPREVRTYGHARRVPRPLETLHGFPVDCVYFRSQRAMLDARDRLREDMAVALESDVKPHDRFLMERFITGAFEVTGKASERRGVLHFDNPRIKPAEVRPKLSVLALDLETDGFEGPILSAALAARDYEKVIVRGYDDVKDERSLLARLSAEIAKLDPDVLCGWNVTDFDLTVLDTRYRANNLPFAFGRAGENARVLVGNTKNAVTIARVPGRAVLDGIATLKSATWSFDRFTLDFVSRELLGRGKKIAHTADPVAEIRRMHAEDVDALVAYNLEDCRLVLDIFDKADLVGFAMERASLTGLAMDRQGGSVAAFDHLYLPRLHRRGIVAPDVGIDGDFTPSPGGHVLDSTPGLFSNVLSFDFRSLYPSIIRTFAIDPLVLVRPNEAPILPALIDTLHDARSKAMADENAALSRAIKILMNSFYGVLGTPGCRFFDSRLPTSITTRGHAIIERARSFFLERGLPVIYGDTDSLFVHFGELTEGEAQERGRAMAKELTESIARELKDEENVESRLELRFESHYLRFLMPTTRGTDKGSKKRYAGVVRDGEGTRLVVRGLEAVRSDWTTLARRVQVELLRRVFANEPYEDWLIAIARDLEAGKLDEELVYRKRLRRELEDYDASKAPPHVRAARMLEGDANEVEYVVTVRGPEPLAKRTAPIDYGHYRDKQVAPVCDVVLSFLDTSFERIAGSQRSLF